MGNLVDYLLDKELVNSLKEAEGVVLSGQVCVNDRVCTSLRYKVKKKDVVYLKASYGVLLRGNQKLRSILDKVNLPITGKTFIDIGASHGGFVQVLLEEGAERIMALDVAYGILDYKLRTSEKVVVLERRNIMYVQKEDLPFLPDSFIMDVSFISLKKVLPHLQTWRHSFMGLVLWKPQFEAPTEYLKQGILKEEYLSEVQQDFEDFLEIRNITFQPALPSGVKGRKGNQEFFYLLSF